MVFVSSDFSEAMKDGGGASGREIGYAFALPRLIARLGGRRARRAELSRWEAYGLGLLIFGISCVLVARAFLPFVRPGALQGFVLFFVPFGTWLAFLVLHYLNALVITGLRRLGLCSGMTNNAFQHFVIISLTTLCTLFLVRDETAWLKSLGIFWLGLLSLNLISILILQLLHEP
jgi:hypothetical protein